MTKFIHIHAKCEAFEIFEQVEEKKAVSRLQKIRANFLNLTRRPQFINDKLVVKTLVINPELRLR